MAKISVILKSVFDGGEIKNQVVGQTGNHSRSKYLVSSFHASNGIVGKEEEEDATGVTITGVDHATGQPTAFSSFFKSDL